MIRLKSKESVELCTVATTVTVTLRFLQAENIPSDFSFFSSSFYHRRRRRCHRFFFFYFPSTFCVLSASHSRCSSFSSSSSLSHSSFRQWFSVQSTMTMGLTHANISQYYLCWHTICLLSSLSRPNTREGEYERGANTRTWQWKLKNCIQCQCEYRRTFQMHSIGNTLLLVWLVIRFWLFFTYYLLIVDGRFLTFHRQRNVGNVQMIITIRDELKRHREVAVEEERENARKVFSYWFCSQYQMAIMKNKSR